MARPMYVSVHFLVPLREGGANAPDFVVQTMRDLLASTVVANFSFFP